jgi:hypothetical protein
VLTDAFPMFPEPFPVLRSAILVLFLPFPVLSELYANLPNAFSKLAKAFPIVSKGSRLTHWTLQMTFSGTSLLRALRAVRCMS